jgi:lipopolysaccharide export system protein LptA
MAEIASAFAVGISNWSKSLPPAKPNLIANGKLEIEGDSVNFREAKNLIVAKGKVKVTLEQLVLNGKEVAYENQTGLLRISGGGTVLFKDERFDGWEGKAGTIELTVPSQVLELSDGFSIDQKNMRIFSKDDTASMTVDLKLGEAAKGKTTGPVKMEILQDKEKIRWEKAHEADGAAAKAVGEIPLADGFDFPVGAPDGDGYYISRPAALENGRGHVGDDWNGRGGGETDLGDPVYSIAHGRVILARDVSVGWGNVIIVRHAYKDHDGETKQVESLYGHLGQIDVAVGDTVRRGQKIGTIGNNRGMYLAHIHVELRKRLGIGLLRSKFPRDETSYHQPSEFIKAHRPGKSS